MWGESQKWKNQGWKFWDTHNTKIEAWGKKKRRGDTEIQNNGTQRRVGLLFFLPIERGSNGSRFTFHSVVVLRWGGILNHKNAKKRDGNFETSKIQKKKRGGIIEAQKKLKK